MTDLHYWILGQIIGNLLGLAFAIWAICNAALVEKLMFKFLEKFTTKK